MQKKKNIMSDEKIRKQWEKFTKKYEKYFLSNDEAWINMMKEIAKYIDENEKSKLYGAVLSLLIHFDLDHTDYFSIIEKQLHKIATNNPETEKFVQLFISFVAEIKSDYNSNARKEALKNLEVHLQEMKNKGEEEQAFEYFDFIRWVKSRHSGIPFSMTE